MNGGTYLGEQILQSSTIDSIMTPQIPSLDPTQGLFWYKLYLGGRWLWGHEGSNLGAMTYMGFSPDENTGVIVFSNTADYIGYQIVDLLFDYASDSIPCSCLPEGITFNTQEQIDNFQTNYPGCAEIEGDVIISDNYSGSITNLNGLNVLTSIEGYFNIYFTNNLTSLGDMNNLISIGGHLWIGYNSLTSLNGLENLTIIGNHLSIGMNNTLVNLNGLENLTSIGSNLWIGYNNSLINLNGLENVASIGGFFWIENNVELVNLSGLENIDAGSIDSLLINNNAVLSNCDVQSICDYLASPNGTISIHDNAIGCNSPEEVEEHCFTDIDEVKIENGLTIIPNPSNNKITISLPAICGNTQLSIFNVSGEKVMERQLTDNETQIDISALPRGVYFVRLQNEKMVEVGKIIKQ